MTIKYGSSYKRGFSGGAWLPPGQLITFDPPPSGGGGNWYDASTYALMTAGADLNNDRYFLPAMSSVFYSDGTNAAVFSPNNGTETITSVDGEIMVDGGSTAGYYGAVAYITTTIGALYKASVRARRGTTPGNVYLSTPAGTYAFTSTSMTYGEIYFTATATTHPIVVYEGNTTGTLYFDDLKVEEVILDKTNGLYPKREATFDEFFAFTASSTTARTYVDQSGVLRDVQYQTNLVPGSILQTGWTSDGNVVMEIGAAPGRSSRNSTKLKVSIDNNSTCYARTNNNIGFPIANTPYTYFADLKADGNQYAFIGSYDSVNNWGVLFDLVNGTEVGLRTDAGASVPTDRGIISLGNGWYRCWMMFTPGSVGASFYWCQIGTQNTASLNFSTPGALVAGNGTLIDHVQLNLGSGILTKRFSGSGLYGADQPRFDWRNGKRQLRLEDQRTNYLWPSMPDGANGWVLQDVTASSVVSGGRNAKRITCNAGEGGFTRIYRLNLTGGKTWSFDFRPGVGIPYLHVRHEVLGATYGRCISMASPLSPLTTSYYDGTNPAGIPDNAKVTALPNGWYRYEQYIAAANGESILVYFSSSVNQSYMVASGGEYVDLADMQLEDGAFASERIPTTTGQITRTIESARLSSLVESILQRNTGSIVVRCDLSNESANSRYIVGNDGSNGMIYANPNKNYINSWNGTNDMTTSLGSGTNDAALGAAFGFDSTGRSLVGNGGTVVTDSDTTGPGNRTTIYLGRGANNPADSYGDGYYDFIGISPERVSDTQLQTWAVTA